MNKGGKYFGAENLLPIVGLVIVVALAYGLASLATYLRGG